jgi:branched-chain amino acid transport system substrate-binding protein
MGYSRRVFLRRAGLLLAQAQALLQAGCLAGARPGPAAPQASSEPRPPAAPAPPPASPVAVASASPAAPRQPLEIKLGGLHPLSGPAGSSGRLVSRGAELAAEQVNQRGGLGWPGGARVRYLPVDTRGRVEIAVQAARRLMQEQAALLLGYQSDVMLAVTELAERERRPVVISLAVADEITERGLTYTFRVGGGARLAARATLELLRQMAAARSVEARRLGILHSDAGFSSTMGDLLEAEAGPAGFEVAARLRYPVGIVDLSAELERLRARQPDVLLTPSLLGDGLVLAQSIARQRLSLKAVLGALSGLSQPALVADLGARAEYLLDSNWVADEQAPATQALAGAVRARWGEPLSVYHVYGYLSMSVALDGLERAGSLDGASLRAALAQTRLDHGGLVPWSGPIEFDPAGQNVNVRPSLLQILGGKVQLVWPPDPVRPEIVFPAPPWERRTP